MPSMAVGPSRLRCRNSFASQGVDPACYRFEVFGVDAMADSTEMVEEEAVRDRPDQRLVGESVSLDGPPPRPTEGAVATVTDVTCPVPTEPRVLDL